MLFCFFSCYGNHAKLVQVIAFFLKVWRALLKDMPLGSMLRIVGQMTADHVLEPGSLEVTEFCNRIRDEEVVKNVRDLNKQCCCTEL